MMLGEYKYSFEYRVERLATAWIAKQEWSFPVRIEGCEWQVGAVNDNDYITLHLKCLSTQRPSRRVPVSFKLSIIKQDGSEGLSRDFFAVFGPDFVKFTADSAGSSIKKTELKFPESEYVKNSCFTIKVQLSPHTAKFRDAALDAFSLPDVNGVEPDLKIIVGGHEIEVHRFVLAYKSKYFQDVVFPVGDEPLILDDCDYTATCTAIRFMYTGECIVNSDNLREVLLIGLKFGLIDLLLSCLDLLSPDNAALFALFIGPAAELPMGKNIPTSPRFHTDFWRYIANNITAIMESNTLQSLTVEEITWFVGRPEVKNNANPRDVENLLLSAQVVELLKPLPSAAADERLIKASTSCVTCKDKIPERVVEPCGHLCFCQGCADIFQNSNSSRCPVCKEEFTTIGRVYLP